MADGHAGDHDHPHPKNELSHYAKRIYAIRELLLEKGIVTEDHIQRQIEAADSLSPVLGARVVARAWTDPEFKARLIADPKAACRELGIDASSINEFVIVENGPRERHVVVCTLCSCYPRALLGRPPDWYKSFNYRARVVRDPRGVLREFGTEVPDDVGVRVHDSTANIRYLVIPLRPAGTEKLGEEELAKLVTRDSMIGVSDPLARPPEAAR
jgi:nitrile hydratase